MSKMNKKGGECGIYDPQYKAYHNVSFDLKKKNLKEIRLGASI